MVIMVVVWWWWDEGDADGDGGEEGVGGEEGEGDGDDGDNGSENDVIYFLSSDDFFWGKKAYTQEGNLKQPHCSVI